MRFKVVSKSIDLYTPLCYTANMNDTQKQQFQSHCDLVIKYGKHFNLTTIVDPAKMWSHHVHDSLAIAPYLVGEMFVDMGTGAGFPGIPLAIHLPKKQFILVDSQQKKIHFLKMVIAQLGLHNVSAIHSRIEDLELPSPVDGIISRAVGDIATMCAQSKHLLKSTGRFYWMKGHYPTQELLKLSLPFQTQPLTIPQLQDTQRHLIIVDHQL
jgi:16S rRNA (guanine527-N7)-methyltransferase